MVPATRKGNEMNRTQTHTNTPTQTHAMPNHASTIATGPENAYPLVDFGLHLCKRCLELA